MKCCVSTDVEKLFKYFVHMTITSGSAYLLFADIFRLSFMCAAVTARQPLLDVRQQIKVFKWQSIYGGCDAVSQQLSLSMKVTAADRRKFHSTKYRQCGRVQGLGRESGHRIAHCRSHASGPTCSWSPVDAMRGCRGCARSAGWGEGFHTAQSAVHWVECH